MANEKTTTTTQRKTPKELIQDKWKNQFSEIAYDGLRTIFSGACFALGSIMVHKAIGARPVENITGEEEVDSQEDNILNFKVG